MHSKIPCNYDHYDYDADDVENIHDALRNSMRDFDLKVRRSKDLAIQYIDTGEMCCLRPVERSRGFLKSLLDAVRDRLDTFARNFLSEG